MNALPERNQIAFECVSNLALRQILGSEAGALLHGTTHNGILKWVAWKGSGPVPRLREGQFGLVARLPSSLTVFTLLSLGICALIAKCMVAAIG